MKRTLIALAVAAPMPIGWAETLPDIIVEDTLPTMQSETQPTEPLLNSSAADTGTLLRQLEGVDGSRMGGHGIDPVIRGQKESRVRIVLDGAEIAPGCPNRMDPPTVYGDLDSFEQITVSRGIATLTEPVENASGGTLALKRKLPDQPGVHGRVDMLKSSLIDYGISVDASAVGEQGALRVFGNRTEAQNYADGNGDTVKASYSHHAFGALAGIRLDERSRLTLSAERSRTEDALYPGAKMDAPYTEGNIIRMGYTRRPAAAWLDSLTFDAYRSTVEHLMDNYSLRINTGKKSRTPTDTETTGGSLKLTSRLGETRIRYGIDRRAEKKFAEGQAVTLTGTTTKAYMWPDTRIERTGLFAETTTPFGRQSLTFGVRYDLMHYDARRVDQDPDGTGPAITARQLYNATYRKPADIRQDEGNFSALLRWRTPLTAGWKLEATASHTARTPDATERYMARFAKDMTTSTDMSWVGNPNLKTEYHDQLSLGLQGPALKGFWTINLWADRVNDYILKDWARNQPGAVNPVAAGWKDMRIIYVNKDAELRGIDIRAAWGLDSRTDLIVSASHTTGYNTTDHRNLAGIPPLSGTIQLNHQRGSVTYGARLNWAVDKSDTDPLAAPDETGKTPGWATLDLHAAWRINRQWQLVAGVDNVFDHAYANYLNRRMDPTQGTSYQVNEPGRSIYAKISARF